MKRLLALIIALCLIAPCALAEGEADARLVEEPVTLTVFMPLEATVALTASNLAELPVLKHIMELTGVNLEFYHPVSGSEKESLNVLIASGDYPDVFRYSMANYSGGVAGAIEDGIIIDLTEAVEANAVNFMSYLNANPFYNKAVRNDAGQIVGFGMVFGNEAQRENIAYVGPILRKDWLDEVGLDIPVTIDDWHEMLVAFKDKLGKSGALGIGNFIGGDWYAGTGIFASAYGVVPSGFYLDDGSVTFAPIQDGYKKYMELMSSWYSEGLINPDFTTQKQNTDVLTGFINGQFGASFFHFSSIADAYSGNKDVEGYELTVAPYPVLNEGDELAYRNLHWGISGGPGVISISASNPDPELTVKFFDLFYSDGWQEMLTWGLNEGDDYVVGEDGSHAFTEKITNNPDGLTYNAARYHYTLAAMPGMWDWELEEASYIYDIQLYAGMDLWKSVSFEGVLPSGYITLTSEEQSRYAAIMTDINTYVSETVYGFILGRESLDGWDVFVETIKGMGIEEATAIQQAAYERYLAR